MIIGHRENLRFLENALKSGNLSHALCFSGPDQVGKRTVAEYISSILLGVEENKLLSHADYCFVKREVDEKKDKLKKDINIGQAKSINSFLANRSWFGGKKIVIIDEAETINIEAANAMLKSIEESSEHSLIILLTIDENRLPSTIKSRCQTIKFFLVAHDEMIDGLKELNFSLNEIKRAIEYSWGRPGLAINLLNDEEKLTATINEISRIKSLVGAPFHKKISAVEDMFGDKDDAVRGRDKIRSILNIWIMVWRDYMLKGSSAIEQKHAVQVMEELMRAQELIGQNIHPRLLIEKLILKI